MCGPCGSSLRRAAYRDCCGTGEPLWTSYQEARPGSPIPVISGRADLVGRPEFLARQLLGPRLTFADLPALSSRIALARFPLGELPGTLASRQALVRGTMRLTKGRSILRRTGSSKGLP